MPHFVCVACGTQHADTPTPPATCDVCADDRQYVPVDGQRWTTHAALAAELTNRIEVDGRLIGVGVAEPFAIPQRALLVPTATGNVMWDCVSVVTPDAVAAIDALGGIEAIAISHPHFYSSMVEWSDAFGGVPIHLHRADAGWIRRHAPAIDLWDGDSLALTDDISLVHLPGHFPGSAALHWSGGRSGRRALLAGDSLHVGADRTQVSVMHSVPNFVPVGPAVIRGLLDRLADIEFDDLYGFTWGRNVIGGAADAVRRSLDRYLRIVAEPLPAA